MEIKKTTQFAGKMKNLHFERTDLLDEDGCVIDLVALLRGAYTGKNFDLSVTSKTEEIIDTEEADEIDISEVEPDEE